MCRRFTVLLLVLLLLTAFTLSGCGSGNTGETPEKPGESTEITVTDMLGRQVSITMPVERVIAIGPGALRLYCYVNGADKLVGIEQMDKEDPIGRPYLLAYPSLADLPVIGAGGPNNAPEPEKIVIAEPDVIFSMYITDKASVDELQAKTGIPPG